MNPLIQWPSHKYWTKAYNPVIGCKKCSEGCQNCYAKGVVERFGINNGDFTPTINPNAKPPRKGVVFVGNMTDIFGEWNDISTIRQMLGYLNLNATNLVLTKRADRLTFMALRHHEILDCDIFYGITAENQERYDKRVGPLYGLNIPAERKWLSLEPLLSAINLYFYEEKTKPFGWVVVGAESGPNRRPCKLEWIESIVQQCRAANVPVFVKQIELNKKLVKDINQFPEHLRIRQVPWAKQEAKESEAKSE